MTASHTHLSVGLLASGRYRELYYGPERVSDELSRPVDRAIRSRPKARRSSFSGSNFRMSTRRGSKRLFEACPNGMVTGSQYVRAIGMISGTARTRYCVPPTTFVRPRKVQ